MLTASLVGIFLIPRRVLSGREMVGRRPYEPGVPRSQRTGRGGLTRNCLALLCTALLLSGCTVGPNSEARRRGSPDVPWTGSSTGLHNGETATLGDQKWWDIFQDEQLRALIHTALQQNYDLRIAASRILEARAPTGITRADQFPTASAGARKPGRPHCSIEIPTGL